MADVEQLEARLRDGEVVILDGAIGTELERLGVTMDQTVWCAMALADHPELVREVHRSYIEAGADVITTNTYAAPRHAIEEAGLADKFEEWNGLAVRLAVEERERHARTRPVYVAGSVSTFGNFGRIDAETMARNLREQAEILVDHGVDLLLLETLGSNTEMVKAGVESTADLGIPLWVTLSCLRRRDSGEMRVGVEESQARSYRVLDHGPLDEAVRDVMAAGGSALLMMHSERTVTHDAVTVMRGSYSGVIGAYPNAGYWERPSWAFVDQVSPEEYLSDAKGWVASGATIVGGCCGIGPDHIRALREGLVV